MKWHNDKQLLLYRESSQKEEERKLLTFADFKAMQKVENVSQFDVRKVDVPFNMKTIPNKFDEVHDEYEIKIEVKPSKKKVTYSYRLALD